MSNNDVKIDHEAAKKMAEAECRSPLFPGQASHNMAACYLDAMAQRDEATELLRDALNRSECYDEDHEIGETDTTRAIRAFLAKHRKTGANHGK